MTDKATHMEAQFRGLAKTSDKDGDWFKIVLWVHPDDCPDELFRVKLRSRLGVAMVQIADDETETPVKTPFKDWAPSRQAGKLCNDVAFQNWILQDRNLDDWPNGTLPADMAADVVRWQCGVDSRTKLNDGMASVHWLDLYKKFETDTRLPEQR